MEDTCFYPVLGLSSITLRNLHAYCTVRTRDVSYLSSDSSDENQLHLSRGLEQPYANFRMLSTVVVPFLNKLRKETGA